MTSQQIPDRYIWAPGELRIIKTGPKKKVTPSS